MEQPQRVGEDKINHCHSVSAPPFSLPCRRRRKEALIPWLRGAWCGLSAAGEGGFAGLDIPIAILAPEEAVERLRRLIEAILGEGSRNVADGLVELEQDPFIIAGQEGWINFALHLAPLHLAEATGIPKLVAEVAAQLDILLVEQHILAERGAAHRAEAQRIGAVLGDEFEIGRAHV